jgi:hypothetical protein
MRFHFLILSCIVILFATAGCALQSRSAHPPLDLNKVEIQKKLAAQISTWISIEAAKAGQVPTLVGAESVLLSDFGTAKINGHQYLTLTADVKDAERLGVHKMFPALVVCDWTGKLLVDIVPKHSRSQLPQLDGSSLGGHLIYQGGGTQDLVMIGDPFCGYCREGLQLILDNLAAARTVRLVSLPLPMHSGASMAAYCMAYMMDHAHEVGVNPLSVARFAYTELQPVK